MTPSIEFLLGPEKLFALFIEGWPGDSQLTSMATRTDDRHLGLSTILLCKVSGFKRRIQGVLRWIELVELKLVDSSIRER